MDQAHLSHAEAAGENKVNYVIRQGVCLVACSVHLTLFWGEANPYLWAFVIFQGFVYPAIFYFTPYLRTRAVTNLLIDSSLYGFCIGLWGFNFYLTAIVIASVCIVTTASGGVAACARGVLVALAGALVGGFATDFTYRAELPRITQLLAATGLTFFLISLGMRMHRINTRLRNTRSDLQEEREELLNLNTLALAVNSHLDVDVIMQSMMHTMERIYPFEALYIIAYEEDQQMLEVSGIYGSSISQAEHAKFRNFRFDMDEDRDSLFVNALIKRQAIHMPEITPEMVARSAQIDRDFFAVKPGISLGYFPVFVNDKVVAGACFINYKRPFKLSERDTSRIEQYLIQVGTAVRNATLFNELTKAKVQAEVAQREAEASEDAKSRFLANMSHEIRTPLTAIMGYSEALQEDAITPEERRKFLGYILRSGNHLLSMINDLLDISKIEASKIEVERINCNLLEVLCDIDSYMGIKAKEKKLGYSMHVTYPIPQVIITDPTRLKQILLNLCNNAVKFTERGHVRLAVKVGTSEQLEFEVEDTGIGINASEQARVFTAFDQADTSTTRLFGGTGLGLYISKNLAQLLGGDITFKSVPGMGTSFHLKIPLEAQRSTYIRSEEQFTRHMDEVRESKTFSGIPTLSGRALVVEDNVENQKLILRLVKHTGMQADLAVNGQKAIEAATKNQYDVILMDMQMPVLGGREAAAAIKASGNETPIIAFTANVMKHHLDEYRGLGFADVLEKPIVREKLFETLKALLQKHSPLHSRRVLIVEDNEVNQMILSRYITKSYEKAEVLVADNGKAAIEQVQRLSFDLILMDMEMPIMGGLEATRAIRDLGYAMPIYIVSGNTGSDYVNRCLNAGASGHIPKPLNRDQIMDVIGLALRRQVRRRKSEVRGLTSEV